MKSLVKFFGGFKSNVDPDRVEKTHGHGMYSHNSKVPQQTGKYQCPMKCEGNKTYPEPGNCPVCNMKLVESEGHSAPGQNGHNHQCC
jgi:hypothetical protein